MYDNDIVAHRIMYNNYCVLVAGHFNAYRGTELDNIRNDKSLHLLDKIGHVVDVEVPNRNNQDRHEVDAHGRNLLNLCSNTALRSINGRDANVGTYTYISDRSATTIDYILSDGLFAKCITEFQVGDRYEFIHMPLILDFQYVFDHQNLSNDISQDEFSILTTLPPKYIWNAEEMYMHMLVYN